MSFTVPQDQLLLVSALASASAGGGEALQRILQRPDAADFVGAHRLHQALALRLPRDGGEAAVPRPWRQTLAASAGHHLLLEHHLGRIGKILGEAGLPWLPFKGMDLATRVYDQPAERPVSDIDLLLHRRDGERALPLLAALGWRDPYAHPRHEEFLKEEGYCWTLVHQDGSALEVHFRLWGLVPHGWGDSIVERALPAPELGPSARRPRLADAYLLAAVHAWMSPPPRPLLTWWDLERIHARDQAVGDPVSFASEVQQEAARWDLQLPVALAAGHAAALWPAGPLGTNGHGEICTGLEETLRRAETRIFHQARTKGTDSTTLTAITAARLMSRRHGRTGLKGAWRRLWSHPGVVGRQTPESWPWTTRRLWHQLKHLGFPGLAERLAQRLNRPDS